MAQGGSSGGFAVVLALIFWMLVLIVAPAAYLMLGPDELLRMWHNMVGY